MIDTATLKTLLTSNDIGAIKDGIAALNTEEVQAYYKEAMIEEKHKWLQIQVMLYGRVLAIQQSAKARPADVSRSYQRIAELWNRLGEADKAVSQLHKAYQHDPEDIHTLQLLATTHVNLAEYAHAIDVQTKAIELMGKKNVSEGKILLGKAQLATIYEAKGDFDKAIELLRECEAGCPKESYLGDIYARLGQIQEKLGRDKEAIETLTRAKKIFEKTKGPEHQKTQEVAYLLEMAQSTEMTNSPF